MARIGIDCRFYSENFGIGRYIIELLNNLQDLDSQNEYFLFLNPKGFKEYEVKNKNFHKVLASAKHYSWQEQTVFLSQLLKHKLDLVHYTNFNGPILYPKKTVITIHDLTLHLFPGKKQNSLIHRLAYHLTFWLNTKHAKQIITVSKTTKDVLGTINKKLLRKTQAITLGISKDFTNAPTLEKISIKLPDKYLLYTGNWREHKNTVNLIKSFALLKKDYNYPGKLIITGISRPDYPNLPQLATELNIKEHVVFPGYLPISELPTLFNKADAYILPSLMEGFGLPALEAMQRNTPVACSNIPSLKEVASNAAIFFDPNSPKDMAEKVNQLLTNETLKATIIQAGKENLKNFSYPHMTSETLKTYLKTI